MTFSKIVATTALKAASNYAKPYVVNHASAALFSPPSRGAVPAWGAKLDIKSIDVPVTEKSVAVDFTAALSSVAEAVVSTGAFLAESYVKGQQEKEARAEDMFRPVVNEVKRKSTEIFNKSIEEQIDIVEQLIGVRDAHKETKEKLDKFQHKTAPAVEKFADKGLKDTLSGCISSKAVDNLQNVLKVSGKVAGNVVPALRVMTRISTAYDAVKVLYPEETGQVEDYVTKKITENVTNAQEMVLSTAKTGTQLFKDRLGALSQDSKGAQTQKTPSLDDTVITNKQFCPK